MAAHSHLPSSELLIRVILQPLPVLPGQHGLCCALLVPPAAIGLSALLCRLDLLQVHGAWGQSRGFTVSHRWAEDPRPSPTYLPSIKAGQSKKNQGSVWQMGNTVAREGRTCHPGSPMKTMATLGVEPRGSNSQPRILSIPPRCLPSLLCALPRQPQFYQSRLKSSPPLPSTHRSFTESALWFLLREARPLPEGPMESGPDQWKAGKGSQAEYGGENPGTSCDTPPGLSACPDSHPRTCASQDRGWEEELLGKQA